MQKTEKSKMCCTFSGQLGDILWSLPTVREIRDKYNQEPVDMAIMPAFESLLPLLNSMEYINKAFVIPNWVEEGRPYGCQPWLAPRVDTEYERVWHLTYRQHPTGMCLMDYIAKQQGITLRENPLPFITSPTIWFDGETAFSTVVKSLTMGYSPHDYRFGKIAGKHLIAYAFNDMYSEQKKMFLTQLLDQLSTDFCLVNISQMPWKTSTIVLSMSVCFVGCRSANYVLAHGMGKTVFCFEPHPHRNAYGPFKDVFGCPYGKEVNCYDQYNSVGGYTFMDVASRIRELIVKSEETVNA